MWESFLAPKPNFERELNHKRKQFFNNMRSSREEEVSSVDRVTMDKNKQIRKGFESTTKKTQ